MRLGKYEDQTGGGHGWRVYAQARRSVTPWAKVRAEHRFDLSDLVRDELAAAGIEVRDTPDGVAWELREGW